MARLPRSLKKRLELAGVPTPLEQAAVPKEWLVPEDIALRRDRLCWRPSKPWPEFSGFKYAYAKRTPGPGLLEQFVALSDAPDEDILRYARQWGVLVICHHGLPASHSEHCRPLTLPGRGRYVFWEPVENWRFFARHAQRVLEMAAATYNGQIIENAIVEKLFQVPPSVKGSGAAPHRSNGGGTRESGRIVRSTCCMSARTSSSTGSATSWRQVQATWWVTRRERPRR